MKEKKWIIEEQRLRYGRIASIVPNPYGKTQANSRPLKGRPAFLKRKLELEAARLRAAREQLRKENKHRNENKY